MKNEVKNKICKWCKKEMPASLEYFYQMRGSRDGLDTRCKSCKRDQWRKLRADKKKDTRVSNDYDVDVSWMNGLDATYC